jgi:hypothetical protein
MPSKATSLQRCLGAQGCVLESSRRGLRRHCARRRHAWGNEVKMRKRVECRDMLPATGPSLSCASCVRTPIAHCARRGGTRRCGHRSCVTRAGICSSNMHRPSYSAVLSFCSNECGQEKLRCAPTALPTSPWSSLPQLPPVLCTAKRPRSSCSPSMEAVLGARRVRV